MARLNNGGIIGKKVTTPSNISALGRWNISEQHIYKQEDIWPIISINIDFLVVAGGGGGGRGINYGGGGGAGGVVEVLSQDLPILYPGDNYTIVIGGGGAGSTTNNRGEDGSISSVSLNGLTLTSIGGGGGGAQGAIPSGRDGGSGAGAGWNNPPASGGTALQPSQSGLSGTYGYGFSGGSGNTSPNGGGGGGGASEAGMSASPCHGGDGRDVSAVFGQIGESGYVGGGGGGSNQNVAAGGGTQPIGGLGGGGEGMVYDNPSQNTDGMPYTGGGGGAGGNAQIGRNGGSGVVAIRCPESYPIATTTGNPEVTLFSGYRIYIFNTSGTITWT